MAAGFLLVGPGAGGVGDAAAFEVVQAEALLGGDDARGDGVADETVPGSVQARLAQRPAVLGGDDEALLGVDRHRSASGFPDLGAASLGSVPGGAQAGRPDDDVVAATLAPVGEHALGQLVDVGQGDDLDAAQPAQVGQLHDVAQVRWHRVLLPAFQLAQFAGTVDQTLHHFMGRQAALLALDRRLDAHGRVVVQVAAVAAPLHHQAQVP